MFNIRTTVRCGTTAALCAVVLAIAAGCGGDDDDDADPTAIAPAATATTAPAATSAAGGFLPAGRVTAQVFQPTVSLEVSGEGWTLADDSGDAFSVEHDSLKGGPGKGYVSVYTPDELRDPADDNIMLPLPSSFVDWLAAHPTVMVQSGPSDVTIGGIAGRQIDVATDVEEPFVHLFDDFGMFSRDRIEVTEFSIDGEMVLVIAGGEDPDFFSDLRQFTDPVIASIQFE
jgi:hypothetical protein